MVEDDVKVWCPWIWLSTGNDLGNRDGPNEDFAPPFVTSCRTLFRNPYVWVIKLPQKIIKWNNSNTDHLILVVDCARSITPELFPPWRRRWKAMACYICMSVSKQENWFQPTSNRDKSHCCDVDESIAADTMVEDRKPPPGEAVSISSINDGETKP